MSTAPRLVVSALLLLTACTGAAGQSSSAAPTPTAAEESSPAVVYQARGTIWVRPSGSASVVDVGHGIDGTPEHPDWSPDGRWLVVEADFAAIWTFAADGSDARRLYTCKRKCFYIQDEAWSPDGEELAFVEVQTENGETTSRALLRVMDVANGHVRNILAGRTGRIGYYSPRWSDDGDSLVFEEDVFASTRLDETVVRRTRVVTVRADGHHRRVLASWRGPIVGPGSPTPDWSGQRVVYVHDDNLVLLNVVTGRSRSLTSYDGIEEHAIQPTFGPDGRSIAFTYVRGSFGVDDVAEGAVVDAETGEVTMLDLPGATHVRLGPS